RKEFAVGTKHQGMDRPGMSFESKRRLAVGGGPEAHRVILAPARNPVAIAAEGDAPHALGMAGEREQQLAAGRLPYSPRFVFTGAGDALAVGGKREIGHCRRVSD